MDIVDAATDPAPVDGDFGSRGGPGGGGGGGTGPFREVDGDADADGVVLDLVVIVCFCLTARKMGGPIRFKPDFIYHLC